MIDGLAIARSFGILHRKSTEYLNVICAEHMMTRYEFVALMYLYDKEGVSQEDLAGMLIVDKAVIARTLKCLEEKQLIIREKASEDRRIKRVYLTAAGWQMKEELSVIIERLISFLRCDFSDADAELIVRGMGMMAQRLASISDFSEIEMGKGVTHDK